MCDIQIGHFSFSQEDICHLGGLHFERRKTTSISRWFPFNMEGPSFGSAINHCTWLQPRRAPTSWNLMLIGNVSEPSDPAQTPTNELQRITERQTLLEGADLCPEGSLTFHCGAKCEMFPPPQLNHCNLMSEKTHHSLWHNPFSFLPISFLSSVPVMCSKDAVGGLESAAGTKQWCCPDCKDYCVSVRLTIFCTFLAFVLFWVPEILIFKGVS